MTDPNPYWQGRVGAERNSLEAFQDGYTAYEEGQKVTDNPHEVGTELWSQWDKGWHRAERDALGDPQKQRKEL